MDFFSTDLNLNYPAFIEACTKRRMVSRETP
jgi:hypothetical protein